MKITKLYPILSILLISACSSMSKQEITQYCENTHWYSLGHAVGEKGEDINILRALKSKCGDALDKAEIRKFQKGYLLGVTTFCTYQNGFEFGEKGEQKPEGCPYELSENFNNGYRNGRLKHQENVVAIRQLKNNAERNDLSRDPTTDSRLPGNTVGVRQ